MTHPVRKGTFFAAVAALVVTAVFAATAVAATARSSARAHPCVVAAGSGDQAFTRNFNPFNLGAQRDFTWGGIYENLLISTAVGGGRQYNLLGENFAWSKDGKTLTITVRSKREVVGRQAADRGGRPLQPHDRPAGQGGRPHQPRPGRTATSRASRASGRTRSSIRFKTVDSTFLGSQLVNVPIVPRHVWGPR